MIDKELRERGSVQGVAKFGDYIGQPVRHSRGSNYRVSKVANQTSPRLLSQALHPKHFGLRTGDKSLQRSLARRDHGIRCKYDSFRPVAPGENRKLLEPTSLAP